MSSGRRREDGVWCPDLSGAIETQDGARLVVALRGYRIDETARQRRAIVAAVWFWADDERYRWLNYALGIGEGEIDEDKEEGWLRVFACRNEGRNGRVGYFVCAAWRVTARQLAAANPT
jgi:hypothetical protein